MKLNTDEDWKRRFCRAWLNAKDQRQRDRLCLLLGRHAAANRMPIRDSFTFMASLIAHEKKVNTL